MSPAPTLSPAHRHECCTRPLTRPTRTHSWWICTTRWVLPPCRGRPRAQSVAPGWWPGGLRCVPGSPLLLLCPPGVEIPGSCQHWGGPGVLSLLPHIMQGVVWGRSPCQADRWVPTRSPAPGAQRPAGTGAAEPGPCPLTAPSAPRPPGAPGTCPSLLHGHHRHHARLPHPRRPAHPWVQHPAAPSMLSDVQWTALPALLPPAPGECGDIWGRRGPRVPKPIG